MVESVCLLLLELELELIWQLANRKRRKEEMVSVADQKERKKEETSVNSTNRSISI